MSAPKRQEVANHERAISALVGYVCGSSVVIPFDRVKTLMQATPGHTPSARKVARAVFATSGVRGLYRGGDVHLMVAPLTVVYYTIYDELLKWQGDHPLAALNAALLARTIEVTLRMPLELLRTRLQAAPGNLTLMELVREQRQLPASSWMRGYTPTLIRDVPFSGIYWGAYEESKRRIPVPDVGITNPALRTFAHSFICGGASGMFAALLTTPVDVVKTLRQKLTSVDTAETAGSVPAAAQVAGASRVPASSSYADILRFVYANPRTMLTGVGPRLLRIPLGLATMMASLEATKSAFERRRSAS